MSESSKVSENYFCIGAFLIFMGSILFCSFGFTILLPFEVTRQWPKVLCKVLNSSFDRRFCSCDEGYSGWDEEITARFQHRQKFFKSQTPSITTKKIEDNTNTSTTPTSFNLLKRLPLPSYLDLSSSSPSLEFSSNCFNKYPCLKIYVRYEEVSNSALATTAKNNNNNDDIFPTTTSSNTTQSITRYSEAQLEGKHATSLGNEYHGNGSVATKLNDSENVLRKTTINIDESLRGIKKHHQIAQLYRSWDDSFYAQCTLIECGEDVWNTKMNNRFRKSWGKVGSSYPCYYDPKHKDVVILEKVSTSMVFHAIFWPILCFMSGAMLWACLCAGCCKSKQAKLKEKKDSTK